MNESVNKKTHTCGFTDEPNDARAVLYGLTLALTAPDQDRLEKVAGEVADLITQSNLTDRALITLQDAAVVLVEYRKKNE